MSASHNPPSDPRLDPELERLLNGHLTGTLDASEQAALQAHLDAADDATLDAVAVVLETEALLHWHHGAVRTFGEPVAPLPPDPDRAPIARRRAWSWAAAALLFIGLAFGAWVGGLFDARPQPTPEPLAQSTQRNARVDFVAGWKVASVGGARYRVTAPTRVELEWGEIELTSTTDSNPSKVTVGTPHGDLEAHAGTRAGRVLVGVHAATENIPQPKGSEPDMNTRSIGITRALVFAGAAALTNALGTASITPGVVGMLAAQQGDAPTAQNAGAASADFGFDLYREFVRGGHIESSFCASPFSIATALAMVAEGARGETARELAEGLRILQSAQRLGDAPQQIPFAWSEFHTGHKQIAALLDGASRAEHNAPIREQIARLMVSLEQSINGQIAARASGDRDALRTHRREERRLLQEIEQRRAGILAFDLDLANAVWADRALALNGNYTSTIRAAYDTGAVVEASFRAQPEAERLRINAWVAERTAHKIEELLEPGDIDQDTRLVLLNAIRFAGTWASPFDPSQTEERAFTSLGGTTSILETMYAAKLEGVRFGAFRADGTPIAIPATIERGAPQPDPFAAGPGFSVLEMPYRGGSLSMVLLLPSALEGLGDLEAALSADNLETWTAALEARDTEVALPKFSVRTSLDLVDALRALGIERVFDRRADLSGMVADPDRDPLYVSKVVHEAVIEVDEVGTEAAAATAAIVKRLGGRNRVPVVPTFRADHPFVYLIRDAETGVVLFLGRFAP